LVFGSLVFNLTRKYAAGATWVDKAAFRDGNPVWGRVVPDIPDFCREPVGALAEE
jgi:protease I